MVECPICSQMQRKYPSTRHLASLAGMKPESVANALQRGAIEGAERICAGDAYLWRVPVSEATVKWINRKRHEAARRRARLASRSSPQAA
jgi:hypothetical protein